MLRQLLFIILSIFALVQLSFQVSTDYDPFYSAGVVEFRPSTNLTAEARIQDNLKGYLTILESQEAKNLDIIVFPESTFNNNDQATFVPDPSKVLVVPCDINTGYYHTLLVQISCAARNLSSYILINVVEKELCSAVPEDPRPCAANGLNIFNTNVVFNRSGAVVSRYRKVNLYGENKNVTFKPEKGWFDTDFGVRFGHFICFDILFYEPAQYMVEKMDIKDFIFPSMWFSQLPFLTAVQEQQAWSYANNVNLLAAGASNPQVGSTGTGIYHGRRGKIVSTMNQDKGERKLYRAQVPKFRQLKKRSIASVIEESSRLSLPTNITFMRDFLENYNTMKINLTSQTSLKQKLCYHNSTFCCNFDLKWQPMTSKEVRKHYLYRLGVFDGVVLYEAANVTNQLKNCALFSCTGDNIMDCGKTMATELDVVFENITITATFPKADRYLVMPNSLRSNIMPLDANQFKWQELDKKYTLQVHYELNTTTSNLMAFSTFGNYYDSVVSLKPENNGGNKKEESSKGQKGSAAALNISFLVVLGTLIITFFI